MEKSKEKKTQNLIPKKNNLISTNSKKTTKRVSTNGVNNKDTKKKDISKLGKSKKNTITEKSKKETSNKNKTTIKKSTSIVEYYDLPFCYNKTVVKLLAQTPNCLFVYWEISQKDVEILKLQFGKEFFYNTKPYLRVINETMNYSFDVEINDYANSWYINIKDSSSKYRIELIRKIINNKEIKINSQNSKNDKYIINNTDILIESSNNMDSPNDHILLEKLNDCIVFKNTKTNERTKKQISSLISKSYINKIYNDYVLNSDEKEKKYIDIPSSNSSYFK